MALVLEKRGYQEEAIAAGVAFLTQPKKRNGIIIVPCGGGKSLIAARIILGLDAPAILFQPRKELLIQNRDKLRLYGYEPSIFSASMGRREIGDITLATIGSVKKYPEYFEDVRYVLIDECSDVNPKQGMYRDFFNALPADVRYLGLDATPFRLCSNSYGSEMRFLTRTRPKVFDEVVHFVQLQELFEAGYLARPEYFSMHKEVPYDESQLELNSTASDFDDRSVQKHLFEIGFQDKLADVVRRLIAKDREGILVFTRFVEEAEFLAKEVPDVAVVSTKTPEGERDSILKAFRRREIRAVANVNLIAIGYDYPELDTAVLARTTMSLRVLYQQVGRIIRQRTDKQPKTPWVVDMVGNLKRFGRIEHLRLYCKGKSQWFFAGRPGGGKEIALTNVYLAGSATMPRCKACQSTDIFFARHAVTGNSAMLSRPREGMKANIVLKENPQNPKGAKVYAIVPAGSEGAEFVNHRSLCKGRK